MARSGGWIDERAAAARARVDDFDRAGDLIGSIIITAGGVAGAAKSLYDRGRHLIAEQKYLGLYWSVATRKDALKVELTRRGIH